MSESSQWNNERATVKMANPYQQRIKYLHFSRIRITIILEVLIVEVSDLNTLNDIIIMRVTSY